MKEILLFSGVLADVFNVLSNKRVPNTLKIDMIVILKISLTRYIPFLSK